MIFHCIIEDLMIIYLQIFFQTLKTDKVDARSIAEMLVTDKTLKPYTGTSYHSEELKSLTRYRFEIVKERAKLKTSVSRLVNILFPELESLVSTLHMNSVYRLLQELPGAYFIASSNLTHLKALLTDASKGHYGREKAIEIRETAKSSIGSLMPAKSMELRQTIRRIDTLTSDIEYSGRFYTACPVMETVDSGMMETAIPEMQNQ